MIRHLEQIEAPYITAWKEAITKIQSRVGTAVKDPSKSIGTALGTVEQKVANEVVRAKITEQIAREIWSKSVDHQKLEQVVVELNKTTSNTKVGEYYLTITADKIPKIEANLPNAYEKIKNCILDTNRISNNTNIPKQIIERVKEHVFIKEHSIDGTIRKFEPQIDILKAWERLTEGNFVQSDLNWLLHEHAEALLMNSKGIDWRNAHTITNIFYNWEKSL